MKKLLSIIGAAGLFGTPHLHASLTITLSQNGYSDELGGEFNAVSSEGSFLANYSSRAKVGGGFETFCIEYSEEFVPGGTYNAVLNSGTVFGGISVGNTPGAVTGAFDPLSLGTAWLYSQFAAGMLANYNYLNTGGTRHVDAGFLQNAIWYFENEIATIDSTNPFYTAAKNHFGGTDAGAEANSDGAYGVKALNLYYQNDPIGYSTRSQDQLVVVPEPSTVIAGALLLLPFAAGTIRSLRRTRKT